MLSVNKKITKEEIADGYDKIVDKIGLAMEFYDEVLGFNKNYFGNILDIGCGRGFLLKKLKEKAKKGSRFFGLDISSKLCDIAKENNPDAEITRGDAENLPFEDDFFDFVFMTEVLEHLIDYNKSLKEAKRVLKKNGIFIVSVPNRDWLQYDFYDKIRNKNLQPVDDYYFRFKEIKMFLQNNGFKIVKYHGLDNLFYYGKIHKLELFSAFFLPFLHKKMKRLLFKCVK